MDPEEDIENVDDNEVYFKYSRGNLFLNYWVNNIIICNYYSKNKYYTWGNIVFLVSNKFLIDDISDDL